MKWLSRLLKLILAILVVVVVLAGMLLLRAARRTQERPGIEQVQREEGLPVRVVQPVRRDFVEYLFCDAFVDAKVKSFLRAQIRETVQEVTVHEGDVVEKGQLLVTFREDDLLAEVEARETAYTEAVANLERFETLYKGGSVSLQALDQMRTAKQGAQSALRDARSALQFAKVYSPIDGVVENRFVEPGEFKDSGKELLTIVDLSRIEVRARVPGGSVAGLSLDSEAQFRLGERDSWQSAPITRLSPSTENPNRFFDVYLEVDNPRSGSQWALRPGMFAEARFAVRTVPNALALPASCVRRVRGKEQVFVVVPATERVPIEEPEGSSDKPGALRKVWQMLSSEVARTIGKKPQQTETDRTKEVDILKARQIRVETGLQAEGFVQIESAELSESDTVVLNPVDELSTGTKVRTVKHGE